MNENFKKLQPYLDKSMALNVAMTLFDWDTETLAPKLAVDQTAKYIGIIAGESYDAIMNEEVRELVAKLSEETENESLSEIEKCIVRELAKDYDRLEKIPADEYQAFRELQMLS